MNPASDEQFEGLEPELRGTSRQQAYPLRRLSNSLQLALLLLRIYTFAAVALVIVVFCISLSR